MGGELIYWLRGRKIYNIALSLGLCFLFLFAFSGVCVAEPKYYQGEFTAPIVDSDLVRARKDAIREGKKKLLLSALKELIEEELFLEISGILEKKILHQSDKYLQQIKVLKESYDKNSFYILLQGSFHLRLLSEQLKANNIPLISAPWHQVTLLLPESLSELEEKFKNRLQLFHIKPDIKTYPSSLTLSKTLEKESIQLLFSQFPKHNILLLYQIFSAETEEGGSNRGVKLSILRKIDNLELNELHILAEASSILDNWQDNSHQKILTLFSPLSLRMEEYDLGEVETVRLEIVGLGSAREREIFEDLVLKRYRQIKKYHLSEISPEKVIYHLETSESREKISNKLQKSPDIFTVLFIENDGQKLKVGIKIDSREKSLQLKPWSENNKAVEEILSAYGAVELTPEVTPLYEEVEPNNNTSSVNVLPLSSLTAGRISGRVDEDLYSVEIPVGSDQVHIEWAKLGKSSFSPYLRLYDGNFKFLSAYRLMGTQTVIKYKYRLPDINTRVIYIRLSDFYGYIPGETGGYKYFNYLLRVEATDIPEE